jgi:hypothetical protein
MQLTHSSYQNILSRQSIRRFQNDFLKADEITSIKESIGRLQPLDRENIFSVKIYKYQPETSSGKALSGLGRIMNPPFFMLPKISGDDYSLVDLGFRTQQIVLDMWANGIGSCYIGCAHRQKRVKQLLELSDSVNIISFLVFGLPEKNQSLRLYQKMSRFFARSQQRMNSQDLFLENSMPKSLKKEEPFSKIIEAGRFAPSATNAQPWRFKIEGNKFIIYSLQKSIANIYDLKQGYSQHDTGICMANMSRAAVSLGKEIHWVKTDEEMRKKTTKGVEIPIAYFVIDDIRSN